MTNKDVDSRRRSLIKSSKGWRRAAPVPLPWLTPMERCRDLSLWSTDRKQIAGCAYADNLHGNRLPASNAAANEPMCPDAHIT